jgi:hypothetical protein
MQVSRRGRSEPRKKDRWAGSPSKTKLRAPRSGASSRLALLTQGAPQNAIGDPRREVRSVAGVAAGHRGNRLDGEALCCGQAGCAQQKERLRDVARCPRHCEELACGWAAIGIGFTATISCAAAVGPATRTAPGARSRGQPPGRCARRAAPSLRCNFRRCDSTPRRLDAGLGTRGARARMRPARVSSAAHGTRVSRSARIW